MLVGVKALLENLKIYIRSHFSGGKKYSGSILIGHKTNVILEESYGVSDFSKNKKINSTTQFFVGSVTKQFTSAALLKVLYEQLHQKGGVRNIKSKLINTLSYPLVHYLDEKHEVWNGSMPDWAKQITLHQLLTHTSGIAEYVGLSEFEKSRFSNLTPAEIVSIFKDKPLLKITDKICHYSNSNYLLLGLVIEKLSSFSEANFLKKHFFDPLQMDKTHFVTKGTVNTLIEQPEFSGLARGYTFDAISNDKILTETRDYEPMSNPLGGGSLISTAADLFKWSCDLYIKNICIPEIVTKLMLEKYSTAFDEEEDAVFYCYGTWWCEKKSGSLKYYQSFGRIPVYEADICYFPDYQLTTIELKNVWPDFSQMKNNIEEALKKYSHIKNFYEQEILVDEMIEKNFPGFLNGKHFYNLKLRESVKALLLKSAEI